MAKAIEKAAVVLMLNVGGFADKQTEYVAYASKYGKSVYSLTVSGIAEAHHEPVDVLSLSREELSGWSERLKEALVQRGWDSQDIRILAGGRFHRGWVPMGLTIRHEVRIGA